MCLVFVVVVGFLQSCDVAHAVSVLSVLWCWCILWMCDGTLLDFLWIICWLVRPNFGFPYSQAMVDGLLTFTPLHVIRVWPEVVSLIFAKNGLIMLLVGLDSDTYLSIKDVHKRQQHP